MIFSLLFSLKNNEENKRKKEGKSGGKFYRALVSSSRTSPPSPHFPGQLLHPGLQLCHLGPQAGDLLCGGVDLVHLGGGGASGRMSGGELSSSELNVSGSSDEPPGVKLRLPDFSHCRPSVPPTKPVASVDSTFVSFSLFLCRLKHYLIATWNSRSLSFGLQQQRLLWMLDFQDLFH